MQKVKRLFRQRLKNVIQGTLHLIPPAIRSQEGDGRGSESYDRNNHRWKLWLLWMAPSSFCYFNACLPFVTLLDISSIPVTKEDQGRFEANKQDMDRFLGPYPYDRCVMCKI